MLNLLRTSALLILASPLAAQQPDILIADFESDHYGVWSSNGEAFGPGPAKGTLANQMHVSGFRGKGLVNSFFQGDGTTGTLTSPPFEINRNYLTFLVGGGGHVGKTCMNLFVDGQVVLSATGTNTQPGGSEELMPAYWDVSTHAGETAVLQIVDQATGTWGHINIDHIVLTDVKPKLPEFARRSKSFIVEQRYLLLPIQNQPGAKGNIQVFVDDVEVRRYQINLASSADTVDWFAYFNLDAYRGKQARVVADRVTEQAFALIAPADAIPGEEDFYREAHRPQFHFTQKVGWNNDPNGMVFHDGKWHLFFQHNPVSRDWGNMTWGHATSTDLLHWKQQANKLFPNTMAVGACFSGGATVDAKNTGGWGENTLVAFLTDTGAGESIAYSTDGGETFTWYQGNPVVKHQGRDPKVIWYGYDEHDQPLNADAEALGGHWVMVVYDEHQLYGRNAAFYTSNNLKDWTEQSHLPGYYECTELFELPVNDDPTNTRWIVYAADAKYAIGHFDGRTFTPAHAGKHQVHWGPYYASQTFDSAPDGRRIQMGWLRMNSPGGPQNQYFSFPHRLTLRTTSSGMRLFAKPIEELEQLHTSHRAVRAQPLLAGQSATIPVASDLLEVRLAFAIGTAQAIELKLAGRIVRYDVGTQMLNGVPLKPVDGGITIQVLADRSITEVIGNDGRVSISAAGPSKLEATEVSVQAVGGDARLYGLDVFELKSIW